MFICYSITYCFSDYVNFYHIFHISLRSSELILYYYIIYYHMFSPMLSCVFIYYTFLIPFSFIYFLYFTCSSPFRVLYFVLSIYCIHVILFIWLSLLCTCICCHIFSYDIHILCFSYTILFICFSYAVILYFSSCSCNCLYFHRIAVLCFSYHVIYSIHVIFF